MGALPRHGLWALPQTRGHPDVHRGGRPVGASGGVGAADVWIRRRGTDQALLLDADRGAHRIDHVGVETIARQLGASDGRNGRIRKRIVLTLRPAGTGRGSCEQGDGKLTHELCPSAGRGERGYTEIGKISPASSIRSI